MSKNKSKYNMYFTSVAAAALVATVAAPIVPAASEEAISIANTSSFPDTKGHKYEKEIEGLYKAKIIHGHTDGLFRPENQLTRSDVVKMLGKWLVAEGYKIPEDAVSNPRFNDIATTKDKELLEYAAIVKDNGIFKGSNNQLMISDDITLEQTALVIVRAMNTMESVNLEAYVAAQSDLKEDASSTSPEKGEVQEAMDVLNFFNIIDEDGNLLNLKEFTNRGEFAAYLYRSLQIDYNTVKGIPAIEKITSLNNTTIEILFADVVKDINLLNFKINGLVVKDVTLKEDGKTVVLTTTKQKEEKDYIVTLNGKEQSIEITKPGTGGSGTGGSGSDGSGSDGSGTGGSGTGGSGTGGSGTGGSGSDGSGTGGSGTGGSGSGGSGSGGSGSDGSGTGGSGSGGSGSDGSGTGGSGSGGSGSDGTPPTNPDGGTGGGTPPTNPDGGTGGGTPPTNPDGGTGGGTPPTNPDGGTGGGTPPTNPGGSLSPADAADMVNKAKTVAEVLDIIKNAVLHPAFSDLNAAQQQDVAQIVLDTRGSFGNTGYANEYRFKDVYQLAYGKQVSRALDKVTLATNDQEVIEALKNVPGLDLSGYNTMSSAEKDALHKVLPGPKYNAVSDLQKVINDAKEAILAPIMAQVNGATSGSALQAILEANKAVLQLDTSSYDTLSAADKTKVAEALFAKKPAGGYTVVSLQKDFVKEVNLLTGHVAPIFAEESMKLVNEERVRLGLYEYKLDPELSRIAQIKAQDMIDNNYLDHNSPTYGSPGEMLTKFGYYWSRHGENLHMGSSTAKGAVDAWIKSPGHYANIKHTEFKNIGAGYAVDAKGRAHWVHMFATQ